MGKMITFRRWHTRGYSHLPVEKQVYDRQDEEPRINAHLNWGWNFLPKESQWWEIVKHGNNLVPHRYGTNQTLSRCGP